MLLTRQLLEAILSQYDLPLTGSHGIAHWARVVENGRLLAKQTCARLDVVELFAVLHDGRRRNEGWDDNHGRRGAELADELRHRRLFEIDDAGFDLLYQACSRHTDGSTQADITIQTCWDADRLDLGRVGIMPLEKFLCTHPAHHPRVITWADERSRSNHLPPFVLREWGIDLRRGTP